MDFRGLVSGMACAWIAPQHMLAQEVYFDLAKKSSALIEESAKASLIRLRTGGRLDFWSLDNEMVGRSRGYQRIVIDEAAFAKNGDKRTAGSMMAIWERSIRPTLYDYGGQALVCSNAAGKDLDNFFYNICTDPRHGFHGGPGFEPGLTESESFIRIRLQSSSTTHRFGPIAERHGPADPEPFALRGCDLVTHALAVVAKSACES
ncbi:MAG: hypothetical protein WCC90_09615 [Methylocella sp.]